MVCKSTTFCQFCQLFKLLNFKSITSYCLSSFNKENNIDCKNDKHKLNSIAHKTPSTVKPPIKLLANRIMIALIIKRNKPSVMMVTGKVRMTKIGFTMKFNKLKTTATIIAVKKLSTFTCGNT